MSGNEKIRSAQLAAFWREYEAVDEALQAGDAAAARHVLACEQAIDMLRGARWIDLARRLDRQLETLLENGGWYEEK